MPPAVRRNPRPVQLIHSVASIQENSRPTERGVSLAQPARGLVVRPGLASGSSVVGHPSGLVLPEASIQVASRTAEASNLGKRAAR